MEIEAVDDEESGDELEVEVAILLGLFEALCVVRLSGLFWEPAEAAAAVAAAAAAATALVVALLIRSEMIVLLLTSQLLGEVGGEPDEGEAELELATELQLPVLRDKSVGSFSLAGAEPFWW